MGDPEAESRSIPAADGPGCGSSVWRSASHCESSWGAYPRFSCVFALAACMLFRGSPPAARRRRGEPAARLSRAGVGRNADPRTNRRTRNRAEYRSLQTAAGQPGEESACATILGRGSGEKPTSANRVEGIGRVLCLRNSQIRSSGFRQVFPRDGLGDDPRQRRPQLRPASTRWPSRSAYICVYESSWGA